MRNLEGKFILFISPAFFGYEKAIKNRLIEWGALVDYFDERPANSFWTKGLIRLNRRFLSYRITHYYNSIIQSIKNKSYDYIFVVNIEAMPLFFLHYIKKRQIAAKVILYMWDSIRNKKNTRDYLPFFDEVFSFDEQDCKNFPVIKFRSLFFLNEYEKLVDWKAFDYDISFIGTAHSDRFLLIRQIKKQIEAKNLRAYWYLYLQNRKLFIWNKLNNTAYKDARLGDFNYIALSTEKLLDIVKKSRVVLDIQHPQQTGLTMRTIETIGAGRKLITTNSSIRQYDFYNPDNILIIDRNSPVIDKTFCKSNYLPIPQRVYYKYSLDGWIEEVLDLKLNI